MSTGSWKDLFSDKVLEEGKQYFLQGKAKKLTEEDYGFSAVVRGARNYHVDIFDDEEELMMYCTCDDGMDGKLCRHMAAVLFLIESEYGDIYSEGVLTDDEYDNDIEDHKSEDTESTVFSKLNELIRSEKENRESDDSGEDEYIDDEYSYFDYKNFIDRLNIDNTVLKEAKKLIAEGSCGDITVNTNPGYYQPDPDKIEGRAYLRPAPGCKAKDIWDRVWSVEIKFDSAGITSANCTGYNCYSKRDPKSVIGHSLCKHEVAAALLLCDAIRDRNPGDSTNTCGYMLMDRVLPPINNETGNDQKGGSLRIEPTVTKDKDGKLSVAFRIGYEKLYKIKKLRELQKDMKSGADHTFGSKTIIKMEYDRLDQRSRKLMDYIEGVLEEEIQERQNRPHKSRFYYVDSAYADIGDSIPLYGSNLDEFYDCMEGEKAEYISVDRGKTRSQLLFKEGDIDASFKIDRDVDKRTGVFHGIIIDGELPRIIGGKKTGYFIENGYFNKLPEEKMRNLRPLSGLENAGKIHAKIGRKKLSEFYRNTMPALTKIAEIDDPYHDEIIKYVPPEPEFVYYFDYLDGTVIARIEAYYGKRGENCLEIIRTPGREYSVKENGRNLYREVEVVREALNYMNRYDPDAGVMFTSDEDEEIYNLLTDGMPLFFENGEVRVTERFKRLKLRKRVNFGVGVSMESGLLDLSIESTDIDEKELLDILNSYKRKQKFYRLKNGEFLSLRREDSAGQLYEMMEKMHIPLMEFVKGKMHLPAYRALYLDKMLEDSAEFDAKRDRIFKDLVKGFKTVDDSDYVLPGSLEPVLRKYQKNGFRWLKTLDRFSFGGILADDMGLGKTLMVISVLLSEKEENPGKNSTSIVVCPASLVFNWGEEIRNFAPSLKVCAIAGSKTERSGLVADSSNYDVIITSYDLLKRDIAEYEGRDYRFIIADEAQYIKNHNTAAAKSLKLLRGHTKYALTGTPIENRLSELWSIFDFLMPGFLYEYEFFKRDYETQIVKYEDKSQSEALKKMVSPFILRRLKKDVLKDLPDKLEECRYAGMDKEQQRLYDAHVLRMTDEISSQDDAAFMKNKILVLAELTKLREICCDPELLFENYKGGSAKRELCMELIRNLIDAEHRILLFSQFTSMLELLEEDLKKEGIEYYKITGATPKGKRLELVKEFNSGTVPVFLISLKAGGTGLNLTGADSVIHYDPWWNVAAQNQASDRAHRIGQERVVTVYKLITKGTVEEKILKLQEMKSALADDILSAEGISSSRIDRNEILELLKR